MGGYWLSSGRLWISLGLWLATSDRCVAQYENECLGWKRACLLRHLFRLNPDISKELINRLYCKTVPVISAKEKEESGTVTVQCSGELGTFERSRPTSLASSLERQLTFCFWARTEAAGLAVGPPVDPEPKYTHRLLNTLNVVMDSIF